MLAVAAVNSHRFIMFYIKNVFLGSGVNIRYEESFAIVDRCKMTKIYSCENFTPLGYSVFKA